MNIRRFLIGSGKVILAIVTMTWLIRSGRLNFNWWKLAWEQWPFLVAIVVLAYAQILAAAFRWRELLAVQGIALTMRETLRLTFVGALFNTVVPGSVGGDVVKAYYVAPHAPRNKTSAFSSIAFDRIVGLVGLMFVAATAAALAAANAHSTKEFQRVAFYVGVVSGSSLVAFLTCLYSSRWLLGICKTMALRVRFVGNIISILEVLERYRRARRSVLVCFGISVAIHIVACLQIYFAALAIREDGLGFPICFLLMPIVLVTMSVPLTPAGVGVGQTAFYYLLQQGGGLKGNAGTNAFTVFQILVLLVYVSGIFSYLTVRRSGSEAATEFSEAGPS